MVRDTSLENRYIAAWLSIEPSVPVPVISRYRDRWIVKTPFEAADLTTDEFTTRLILLERLAQVFEASRPKGNMRPMTTPAIAFNNEQNK